MAKWNRSRLSETLYIAGTQIGAPICFAEYPESSAELWTPCCPLHEMSSSTQRQPSPPKTLSFESGLPRTHPPKRESPAFAPFHRCPRSHERPRSVRKTPTPPPCRCRGRPSCHNGPRSSPGGPRCPQRPRAPPLNRSRAAITLPRADSSLACVVAVVVRDLQLS